MKEIEAPQGTLAANVAKTLGLAEEKWNKKWQRALAGWSKWIDFPLTASTLHVRSFQQLEECEKVVRACREMVEDKNLVPQMRVAAAGAVASLVRSWAEVSAHSLDLKRAADPKAGQQRPANLPPTMPTQINIRTDRLEMSANQQPTLPKTEQK